MTLVSDLHRLTNVTKSSILDVAVVLDRSLKLLKEQSHTATFQK